MAHWIEHSRLETESVGGECEQGDFFKVLDLSSYRTNSLRSTNFSLHLRCYGLAWLGVGAELVQDLGNDFGQLEGEVVKGLELEDQRHDSAPSDGLVLRRRLGDGLPDFFRGS